SPTAQGLPAGAPLPPAARRGREPARRHGREAPPEGRGEGEGARQRPRPAQEGGLEAEGGGAAPPERRGAAEGRAQAGAARVEELQREPAAQGAAGEGLRLRPATGGGGGAGAAKGGRARLAAALEARGAAGAGVHPRGVEAFLLQNPVEAHAAQKLRALPHDQARMVCSQSLSGARDKTAVILGRIRNMTRSSNSYSSSWQA
ncbi:unnamed protein product, partial [Prorocentrum cordatum]